MFKTLNIRIVVIFFVKINFSLKNYSFFSKIYIKKLLNISESPRGFTRATVILTS